MGGSALGEILVVETPAHFRYVQGGFNTHGLGIQTGRGRLGNMFETVHFLVPHFYSVGVVRLHGKVTQTGTTFKTLLVENDLIDWAYLFHLVNSLVTTLAHI
jgi:hypothetical protein